MFRTLMVPVDGSAFGEQAVPFALGIARRAGAKIEFARVHEFPTPARESAVGMELLDENIRRDELDYLDQLATRVSAATSVPFTSAPEPAMQFFVAQPSHPGRTEFFFCHACGCNWET